MISHYAVGTVMAHMPTCVNSKHGLDVVMFIPLHTICGFIYIEFIDINEHKNIVQVYTRADGSQLYYNNGYLTIE